MAEEWLGWTLDRTADIPRCHRFSFGDRLDRLTLELLETVIEARFAANADKPALLRKINLLLEKLRAFWRLAEARGWINQRQLLHTATRLDEMGRMAGGWLKSLEKGRP